MLQLVTQHEERSCQINADELDAEVHGQPEGGDGAHHSRQVAEETQPRLGAHPVDHRARDDAEDGKHSECYAEEGHDGASVALKFDVEGATGEAGCGNVPEETRFGVADRREKRFLPRSTSDLNKQNKQTFVQYSFFLSAKFILVNFSSLLFVVSENIVIVYFSRQKQQSCRILKVNHRGCPA